MKYCFIFVNVYIGLYTVVWKQRGKMKGYLSFVNTAYWGKEEEKWDVGTQQKKEEKKEILL